MAKLMSSTSTSPVASATRTWVTKARISRSRFSGVIHVHTRPKFRRAPAIHWASSVARPSCFLSSSAWARSRSDVTSLSLSATSFSSAISLARPPSLESSSVSFEAAVEALATRPGS